MTPAALSSEAGMHRFVWPIRYQPSTRGGAAHPGRGDEIWAPPGEYKVVLSAGGERLEQPLTVEPDPRVKLPQSAYDEEFALARQVAEARAPLQEATSEADALIAKLGARQATEKPALAAAIADVLARASTLSDINYSSNPANSWWIAPQRTTTLRFLDAAFGSLAGAIDGADAAPSADAKASYATLKPLADTAVRAWNDFKAKDLAALNGKLKSAGEEPIEPK